jgi:shikimate kinase/3-dehydroquinate synthase
VVGALGRHIALAGFMGAGKSTVGARVAEATARPFVDLDELIEQRHGPIQRLFERGEVEFRLLEEETLAEALVGRESVIALGGGAVVSRLNRERLRARAFTVFLEVDAETAWERVRGSDRPLARSEDEFRSLYASRRDLYETVADAVVRDADDVLLAALAISVPGTVDASAPAVVADERVLALHPLERDGPVHTVPAGEAAKTLEVVERLWSELEVGRDGALLAYGGGSTTDVTGFVAATYLRGLPWTAAPTTLTGMVDAAIGGKTGINTRVGKNLAGAFHFPESVVIDPAFLATLPDRERRAGMAEVVKTGLLAGRDLWALPEPELIRACAAYKAGVVLSDPYETEGRRAVLNLGHTFAHALEAGSGFRVPHGEAVALGLLAALRLSGNAESASVVESELRPRPVRVDRERAWAALRRDKKARDGRIRLVLLPSPGAPEWPAELPEDDVRRALDELIAE